MKDAFYTLKPFFFLKIFKFCPDFFIAVKAWSVSFIRYGAVMVK